MQPSIMDLIDLAELRLWCLIALAQNPHLARGLDGTMFISNGVSYPIFKAIRSLATSGKAVTPLAVYNLCDRDRVVGLGLIEVFKSGATVDERMAGTYLRKLTNRMELSHAA
jgi:hypothetical protein